MKIVKKSKTNIYNIIIAVMLLIITLTCILPFVHLLAISLSAKTMAGEVSLLPKSFTINAYKYLAKKPDFIHSLLISLQRVILGTSISMVIVILTAYPLSKESRRFKGRTAYAWFFATTMFFSGGLIPTYMLIRYLHIINSIWALVLPTAANIWNVVMLVNFFRVVPKDLEEAAIIDGAGQWTILLKIYLPVSLPALATVVLFTVVEHWNSWFDGIIYMNEPKNYPLQSYIYILISAIGTMSKKALTSRDIGFLQQLSEKTLQSAQIFLAALPIMLVYPMLQKYFIKGIVLGGIKE